MGHLFAILIVAVAHAADRGMVYGGVDGYGLRGWPAAAIVWGAPAMIVLWHAIIVRLCTRRIAAGGGHAYLAIADYATVFGPVLIIVAYIGATIFAGWHATVQMIFGRDVIFFDLVITILPPILGLTAVWFNHYPIVRRLRDAALLRALDEGRPVHAMPSRWRYVFTQLRVNILFLLAPLLLIVAWSDFVDLIYPIAAQPEDRGPYDVFISESITIAGALVIFLFAPLMARIVLDLHRLPEGPIRTMLLRVCSDHRVRVRDVLLWRTDGGMINGAVMGLIGPLRYVMLTDALLEWMNEAQIEAVMAHEIGHVKRHHMPWLIAALFAVITLPTLVIDLGFRIFARDVLVAKPAEWIEYSIGAAVIAFAFFTFGWVSRRFERQADTFAAQHLSGLRERARFGGKPQDDTGTAITPHAAAALQTALDTVCRLNGIDPHRRSWRHGSIRWRQMYLAQLVGRPLRRLGIDRQVRWIKLATALILAGAIGLTVYDVGRTGRASPEPRTAEIGDPEVGRPGTLPTRSVAR